MDLQGYALIKPDATCNYAMGKPADWQNKTCRVIEFNDRSGSLLAINPQGTAMGMFDYSDIQSK